jgi:gamma-glutamyltranspeptidase
LPDTAHGTPPSWAGKAFRQGVVTVNNPLAAEAGAQALEKGGKAFDAIAAIQFAMNVVEPEFSGIGGGGFMVIHLAQTNETFMLDCREKAQGKSGLRITGASSWADLWERRNGIVPITGGCRGHRCTRF